MPTLHTSKHVHPSIEQPLPSRTIQPNSTRPHTHIRAYMHTHLPSRTHAHVHTFIHTLVQSFTHTCVHPYIHTYSTRTHTHTHACGTYICTWRRTETCKKTNVTNHARIYGCTLQDHSRACTYHVLDAAAKTGVDSRRALAGKPLDDCSQLMQVILRLHPCLLRVLHARHWDECVRKIATIFHKALGIGKRLRTPLHTN